MQEIPRTTAHSPRHATEESYEQNNIISKTAIAILIVDAALFTFAPTGLAVTAVVLEGCAYGLNIIFPEVFPMSTTTKVALAALACHAALFIYAPAALSISVVVLEVCAVGFCGFVALAAYAELEGNSGSSYNRTRSQASQAIRDLEESQANFRRESERLTQRLIADQSNTYRDTLNTIREDVEDMEKDPIDLRSIRANGVNVSIEMLESNHEFFCSLNGSNEQLDELSRWLENEIDLLRRRIAPYVE